MSVPNTRRVILKEQSYFCMVPGEADFTLTLSGGLQQVGLGACTGGCFMSNSATADLTLHLGLLMREATFILRHILQLHRNVFYHSEIVLHSGNMSKIQWCLRI